MTLELNGLEIVETTLYGDLTSDNFSFFKQDGRDLLTFSTELANQRFDLRLRARTQGQLSEMMAITNEITPARAFDAQGAASELILLFDAASSTSHTSGGVCAPNPWSSESALYFSTKTAGAVSLTVVNQLGQVVYELNENRPSGYQKIEMNRSQIQMPGIYWCRLVADGHVNIVKMAVSSTQ